MIESFTFTVGTDNQDGSRVHDTSTVSGTVSPTQVTDIVLKNATDDPDNFFGILLNASYSSTADALAKISYTYTTQFASGAAGGEPSGGAAGGEPSGGAEGGEPSGDGEGAPPSVGDGSGSSEPESGGAGGGGESSGGSIIYLPAMNSFNFEAKRA